MITIEKPLPPCIEAQLIPIKVANPRIDVSKLRKHLRLILDGTSERSVRMWTSSGPQERIITVPMTTDGQKQRNFRTLNETHATAGQNTRYTKDRSRNRKWPFCDKLHRPREFPVYETAQKRIARTRELGRCLNCLGEHYAQHVAVFRFYKTNTTPQELDNTESLPLSSRNTVQSGEQRNTTRYDLRTSRRLKKLEFFTLLA
uniref:Uncharacterized protein n=1 Tax=Heterorhabditis bacteriophora TaxID=37862 RepID=A0A1I7XIP3_HETBA